MYQLTRIIGNIGTWHSFKFIHFFLLPTCFRIVLSIRKSSNGVLTYFTVRSSLSASNNGIRRSICRGDRRKRERGRGRGKRKSRSRAISPRLDNFGPSWKRGGGLTYYYLRREFRNLNRPVQRDSIKFGKGQEILIRSLGKIRNSNIHAVQLYAIVENDLKFLDSFYSGQTRLFPCDLRVHQSSIFSGMCERDKFNKFKCAMYNVKTQSTRPTKVL